MGEKPMKAVSMCSSLPGKPCGGVKIGYQPSNQNDTLQGTNISPKNGILKMIFLFPRWDMLIPCRVTRFMHLIPLWYARRPKKPLDCHNPQPDTAQQHRWCSGQDEVTGENRRGRKCSGPRLLFYKSKYEHFYDLNMDYYIYYIQFFERIL